MNNIVLPEMKLFRAVKDKRFFFVYKQNYEQSFLFRKKKYKCIKI